MALNPILYATKDNAKGTLLAGISAGSVSVVLNSSQGALFPQPYNGTATSLGTATTLNSTGILAIIGSGAVGKFIRNTTDGCWALITAVGTNSVTCTRLQGGSNNIWSNSDAWRIDEFVITLANITTSSGGVITINSSEKALIIARATDTLTVASGGRGYDGSSAASWATADSVYLFVTSQQIERMKDTILQLALQIDNSTTSLGTTNTNVTNLQTGAYQYVVTTGSANAYVAATPALAAYAAGNEISFKANFACTGASTINVNGLGAKTIKKLNGTTDLVSGDIANGQMATIKYDGTNFQLMSPVANVAAAPKVTLLNSTIADSTGVTAGSFTTFSDSYTILANTLAAGDVIDVKFLFGTKNTGVTGQVKTRVGGTATYTSASADMNLDYDVNIRMVVRSIGASGHIFIRTNAIFSGSVTGDTGNISDTTIDTTANIVIDAQGLKSVGAGTLYLQSLIVEKKSL